MRWLPVWGILDAMQIPEELQLAIDELVQNIPPSALKKAREELSQNYKASPSSFSIFRSDVQKLAYLTTRMPATYAAIRSVLQRIVSCRSFLDLGAGPGTASWAAFELFPELEKVSLMEHSQDAISMGQKLAEGRWPVSATWIHQSLEAVEVFPEADVAVLSYVLNEVKNAERVVERCWNSPISTLVIIEPGTPRGFSLLKALRQKLISWGAHLVAPCPHAKECPIQGSDWCHFSSRVERTRLHRYLKEGSLGYEDEKFSYLIVSKAAQPLCNARIIRHPQKNSGHVRLSLCTNEGSLKEKVVTRSDKISYKAARDAEWGDSM